MIAIVDTSALVAATDRSDVHHRAVSRSLRRADLDYVVPALVVAEAAYLIGRKLGAAAEARFVRSLGNRRIEPPASNEWGLIADLMVRYLDFPLGVTDASAIVLAERLKAPTVITLDRRHFGAVRPAHVPAFELLPG